MTLDYVVGVDLGSTTTKAVILDLEGAVLGRGITNSRSDYQVAADVAVAEALTNARFSLIRGEGIRAGLPEDQSRQLVARLRRAFSHQQYLVQLANLERELQASAEGRASAESLRAAITDMIGQMREESGALFRPGAARKSDFFRDLAGGRFNELAEAAASSRALAYDEIVGLFDKAIIVVENTPDAAGAFRDNALAALTAAKVDRPEFQAAVASIVDTPLERRASVGTGYGRARLPFPKVNIRSEILCHALGAHAMFPGTRTVLDIGGQDTKAIQVDERGIVTSFQMNDRCAAGCGRYLGYIADEMNLGLHQLGPLAQQATRRVRINSTCTVFAGAELRERLALGEKREDILAGLHRAIILRAISILARSGGVYDEFTFTGGVANNPAATAALRQLVTDNYGELTMNISPNSIYTGALGAAIFAKRAREQELRQDAAHAAASQEARA